MEPSPLAGLLGARGANSPASVALSHPAGCSLPARPVPTHSGTPEHGGDPAVPAAGLASIAIAMVIAAARSARGLCLISIPSQPLPRCLRILPALTAHSAHFGQELGPDTAAESGRAGQGRIPAGRAARASLVTLSRADAQGGPPGPSALPGHTRNHRPSPCAASGPR